MALIHVFNGITSDDVQTYSFLGPLRDNIPGINWEHTLILRSGYRITPDYCVKEDDIIFIRMLPKGMTAALIAVSVTAAVIAIGVGIAAGVIMYKQQQRLKEMEKAQRAAKAAGEKTQRLPFVKGARNQAATGQTFPYTLGETLFTPYRLCSPHYTLAGERGEDQYFNILLECGFNDLLIKKLNLKNTAVKTWQDTAPQNGIYDFDYGTYYDPRNKIEIRQTGDFTLSAFNKKIIATHVNKEIPHEHAGEDANENARIEKEWRKGVVQELASHPMHVEVMVLFSACRKFDDDIWKAQSVTLAAEWTDNADAENPTWYPFDGAFNQNGTYSNTFTYNTKKQMRYSACHTFAAAQSYGKKIAVRLTRVTPKAEKNSQENVYLLTVQTTCYDPAKSNNQSLVAAQPLEPHLRDKCTRIAIRIVANENTTDMLDSFSVIQTGCARIWDKHSKTWSASKHPTRNLAAWTFEVLTSDHHSPSRYADSELDLDSFGAWYEYCEKEGFYADGVITRSEKKKATIETLCQNGNAALVYNEFTGKIEVAVDNGRDYSVALLNSENIISIQNTKTFKRKTDGKKVTYINRDADYDIDSVTFMKDGAPYNPETHTISVTALKYITDYAMAYKYVWRQMAEEEAAPRTVTVKVGLESAYYPLFSRVEVQHKTLPVGLSYGIVSGTSWFGGLLRSITIDGYVDFPEQTACGVLIHCVNDAAHGVCALRVSGSGRTNVLTVETPLRQSADYIPQAGDAFSFGLLDNDGSFSMVSRSMKIVNVEPADYGYTLTLKDYNPALYQYGTLPEYKSSVTRIPDGSKKKIDDKHYLTSEDLVTANEQALREAAQEAAEKIARQAAQEAANVVVHGKHFSTVHRIEDMSLSLETLLEKIDSDAKTASDGISATQDMILLKVEDTEKALRAYIAITKDKILQQVEDDNAKLNATLALTKDQILAQADDMRKELKAQLAVQASAVQALVEGGGSSGRMSLSIELPVVIDAKTRQKLVKASTEEKVSACYARVAGTDYYGLKNNLTPQALKPLWEDARRAALLASQFSVEADQIQFKSDNVFVNGKLKADYIDALELAAKKTFTDALTVKRFHIDSKEGTHQDFEAWFDETNGLKIMNKGKEIFKVDTNGTAVFSGEINCNGFQVLNTDASSPIGQELFRWGKGDDAFSCALKILKVNKLDYKQLANNAESENKKIRFIRSTREQPWVDVFYGHGIYGNHTIRCVIIERRTNWLYSSNCWVKLYNEASDLIEVIRVSIVGDVCRHDYTEDSNLFLKYVPSAYNFTFYAYTPKQKILMPNIGFGRPAEKKVLYYDEQGVLKIS